MARQSRDTSDSSGMKAPSSGQHSAWVASKMSLRTSLSSEWMDLFDGKSVRRRWPTSNSRSFAGRRMTLRQMKSARFSTTSLGCVRDTSILRKKAKTRTGGNI